MTYFSDPYARVVFGTQSQVTEILTSTICPTWDQTLIFENVQIYGSVDKVARHPPEVIIELFDKDPVVSQSLTCPQAFSLPLFPRSPEKRLITGHVVTSRFLSVLRDETNNDCDAELVD